MKVSVKMEIMCTINSRWVNIFVLTVWTSLGLVSCDTKKDCSIDDQLNGQWTKIDSTHFIYRFCRNSGANLAKDDIIELEYIGSSAPGKTAIEFDSREQQLLMMFGIIPIGKYKLSDKALDVGIQPLLGQLKKNAIVLLQINSWNDAEFNVPRKLTLYFNNKTGDKKISSLLKELKKQYAFIDSSEFISRDAAMESYNKENDSTWKKLLQDNPLPASADIYINRQASDSLPPEKLSDLFNGEMVTEITDNKSINDGSLQMFEKLQRKYYIKIRTGK